MISQHASGCSRAGRLGRETFMCRRHHSDATFRPAMPLDFVMVPSPPPPRFFKPLGAFARWPHSPAREVARKIAPRRSLYAVAHALRPCASRAGFRITTVSFNETRFRLAFSSNSGGVTFRLKKMSRVLLSRAGRFSEWRCSFDWRDITAIEGAAGPDSEEWAAACCPHPGEAGSASPWAV